MDESVPKWKEETVTVTVTVTRSRWPAAQHLQQAADETRQAAAELPDDVSKCLDPMADWLDKTALDMAWLAPYRQHEPGHAPWRIATRAAHGVLDLPNPDTCPICHPQRPGTAGAN